MQLEAAGVPTVVLVTKPFLPLARQAAKANDLPAARIVTVPHPLGGAPEDTVRAHADAAVDAVVAALRDA